MMHPARRLFPLLPFRNEGSRRPALLLWAAAAGVGASLLTVAAVAWRAADQQRRDGEGAMRQAAADAAALKAAELEARINDAWNATPGLRHARIGKDWFTAGGDTADWIFGPWPRAADGSSPGDSPSTAAGLPAVPLALRRAMDAPGADRPGLARQLLRAAVDYPSALSTMLFADAAACLPNVSGDEDVAALRRTLEHQERVRAVLRAHRDEAAAGAAWIESQPGEWWHLAWLRDDSLRVMPGAELDRLAGEAGVGLPGVPSLPEGWLFHALLEGVNLQSLVAPGGGIMATHSRGPLTVQAVAEPPEAFAGLDAQLVRQRWLTGGATGFMALAALGFFVTLRRQQRLNEMMSGFVAAVSHELRAPVGSIGLLAERLSDGRTGSPEELAGHHRLIRDECRRLTSTIGNVLTFSRRQRGLLSFETELTDLAALVRDAVDLMRPLAAERNAGFALVLPEGPVERELDPVLVRQAVVNLLDNAVKFSPGGGTVRVRLSEEAESGAAVITVSDDGPGVPVRERANIFRPFYRSGSELRRETPGIGIGLAIVEAAARAHGGSASAGDAPGGGAEFVLRLGTAPVPSV